MSLFFSVVCILGAIGCGAGMYFVYKKHDIEVSLEKQLGKSATLILLITIIWLTWSFFAEKALQWLPDNENILVTNDNWAKLGIVSIIALFALMYLYQVVKDIWDQEGSWQKVKKIFDYVVPGKPASAALVLGLLGVALLRIGFLLWP
ncbi:MAG: hypothetical protein ACE5Q6_13600 [Dehalococcoidia bacterium]